MHGEYIVTHKNGKTFHSSKTRWTDHAEKIVASLNGQAKYVYASKDSVKKIHVKYKGMEHEIEVPEGHRVYQAILSETLVKNDVSDPPRVLGIIMGLVKDNEVVEEYFMDGMMNQMVGFKYK
jgi:hypothetical protein